MVTTKKTSTATKVTRIKATDAKPKSKKETPTKKVAASIKKTTKRAKKVPAFLKPFAPIGRYFKGAWVELGQVRWPTRSATWGLTGAVLAFSAFFVILILLLDAAFKFLFETILK